MEFRKIFKNITHLFEKDTINADQMKAGTGFMLCLSDQIRELQKKGYTENLTDKFDHFSCQSGKYRMYPSDFYVDEIVRFDNSSDPDDQSILYAISCDRHNLKGLYIESYGTYHEDMSPTMLERIKFCQKHDKQTIQKGDLYGHHNKPSAPV